MPENNELHSFYEDMEKRGLIHVERLPLALAGAMPYKLEPSGKSSLIKYQTVKEAFHRN